MAVKARQMMYPMAEMIEVAAEGTTIIDLMDIPAGTIIESVLVRVKTPATGPDASLTVGDADSANGFILAADAKAAAGTIYGDDIDEVGAYLKAAVTCAATSANAQVGHNGHLYAAAAKVKFVLSAAATGGVYQVFVTGKRFAI